MPARVTSWVNTMLSVVVCNFFAHTWSSVSEPTVLICKSFKAIALSSLLTVIPDISVAASGAVYTCQSFFIIPVKVILYLPSLIFSAVFFHCTIELSCAFKVTENNKTDRNKTDRKIKKRIK